MAAKIPGALRQHRSDTADSGSVRVRDPLRRELGRRSGGIAVFFCTSAPVFLPPLSLFLLSLFVVLPLKWVQVLVCSCPSDPQRLEGKRMEWLFLSTEFLVCL